MSQPINRTVSLSPARRLVCDVMHFSKKVPIVIVERRLKLAEVANARSAARDRPSWFAVFAKAYGIIASRRPELRRSYMSLPWPRLFEHARNVAVVPIERRLGDEDVVLYVPLAEPEKLSIADLNASISKHKDEPLENISFFRTQIWMSRLPQPLRRFLWWLGFNLWGRVRAYFYGTFGVTSVGAFGATAVTIQSPLTTTLTFGAIDAEGGVSVRLCFDHRVMDGAAPARALVELEQVLNGELLTELRSMQCLLLNQHKLYTLYEPELVESPYAAYSDQRLDDCILSAREQFKSHHPNSKAGKEASHEIDVLSLEYQRRRLTIPMLKTGDEPIRRKKAS
jgi:hypothetical protein